jgi:hypothetical protein
MTSAPPGELTASSVIQLIDNGAYPRDIVMTIARGFLPLPQEDLVGVLAYLTGSDDEEIASASRASLGEMQPRAILEFAMNDTAPAAALTGLLGHTQDGLVIESLIRNRALPDEAIVALARVAQPAVQDVIVINQARILRAPQILDALLDNPQLTSDARRRALETREEFFEKKARLEAAEEAAAAEEAQYEEEVVIDAPLDAIADLLERAEEENGPGTHPSIQTLVITESEKEDPKKFAIWARLHFMSVGEKVQLAFKGDRMLRMLLVRDRNKLICSAVMRNPRLTENEVESIAGMRNVDEEVLRLIGNRRDWTGKYNIMLTLCRNPKVPVGVVLPFINRLTLRDLKTLKDDKGVTQVVRETAKKFYLARTQKTG